MARLTASRAARRGSLVPRQGACGRSEFAAASRAWFTSCAMPGELAARSSCRSFTCTVAASVEEPQRALISGLIRHGSGSLHGSRRVGCVAIRLELGAGLVQAWPRARHRRWLVSRRQRRQRRSMPVWHHALPASSKHVTSHGRRSVGMTCTDNMSAFGSVRAIVVSAPAMAHRAGWWGLHAPVRTQTLLCV